MKTRAKQIQTTKRINMDTTSSTIVTPIKQRRLIDHTTENLKSSMIVSRIL
jgi:hypothetical protein